MTGPEFREARQRAGLSYTQAARLLGCARSTVQAHEQGRSIPSTHADAMRQAAKDQRGQHKEQHDDGDA